MLAVITVTAALPPCAAVAQVPTPGPEFRVNVTTIGDQTSPAAATQSDNGYVVVWRDGGSVVGRLRGRLLLSGQARSPRPHVGVPDRDLRSVAVRPVIRSGPWRRVSH
jgi:hypothetical protein